MRELLPISSETSADLWVSLFSSGITSSTVGVIVGIVMVLKGTLTLKGALFKLRLELTMMGASTNGWSASTKIVSCLGTSSSITIAGSLI